MEPGATEVCTHWIKTVRTKSAFAPRRWGVTRIWGGGGFAHWIKTVRTKSISAPRRWARPEPGSAKVCVAEEKQSAESPLWHFPCGGMVEFRDGGVGDFCRAAIGFISRAEYISQRRRGDVSMGRRPCRHSRCVLPTQHNGFPGGKIHEKFGKSDKTSA